MTNEELALAIQAGDNVTDNMEQLYKQNWAMICKLTYKYKGVESVEDLRQESFIALSRAAILWDPARETQFLTFAIVVIRSALYRYVTDCGALIRIPENQRSMVYKHDKIMSEFRAKLGRDATPAELQALLNINKERFERLQKDRVLMRIRSTSEPVGDDGESTLEDFLPDDNDRYEDVLDRIQQEQLSRELWAQVDQLPEREAAVVRGKYQNGQTYAQSGEELGVSQERVRQLHERALKALRRPKVARRLLPYLSDGTAYSIGTRAGFKAFARTHTTAQERAIIMLEERTGPIWQNVRVREDNE